MSPETLRKAGVGIKLVADADMLRANGESTVSYMSDGYVERQKMRDLTAQVNKMYRAEARDELLRETIAEAVGNLVPLRPITYAPYHGQPSGKELVLCIGDMHFGANINIEGLEGETINHYDSAVFEERMEKLFDETVDIIKKENIDVVNLFMVGDLIDGMLRQSQLVKLEYGMVDSTIRFADFMSNWVLALADHAFVKVAACSGNHSEVRPLGSKKREFPNENMERIILWFMAERLRNYDWCTSVDENCKRFNKKNVLGYSFLLLHGDAEKDIPQFADETIRLYGKPIDFFVCGHKHRENEYPTGVTPQGTSIIIRVPSICGADSYAQSKSFGGKPGAIAIVMEKGYGRRCVYPIQL